MAAPQDVKSIFSSLEERIQKLIHLCEELKSSNNKLLADKRQMQLELQEEREKIRRMEEGYKNLKEMEKSSSRQSITNMKRKISDIMVEIDKNMSLIEDKS
jgi:chromosome segregation ATPase